MLLCFVTYPGNGQVSVFRAVARSLSRAYQVTKIDAVEGCGVGATFVVNSFDSVRYVDKTSESSSSIHTSGRLLRMAKHLEGNLGWVRLRQGTQEKEDH